MFNSGMKESTAKDIPLPEKTYDTVKCMVAVLVSAVSDEKTMEIPGLFDYLSK